MPLSRYLGEMVGSLNVGYRRRHSDPAEAGDRPSTQFVVDVLTFPALHPSKNLSPAAPASARFGQRSKLSRSVEYISKDDLIAIVCRLSGVTYVEGEPVPDAVLPANWYGGLPDDALQLEPFVAYIDDFFETAEGVSSDDFTASTKRLTRVLALIVVAVLNLNAFDLAKSLYTNRPDPGTTTDNANQALAVDVAALHPEPMPPPERQGYLSGQSAELRLIGSLLDDPSYSLGWQHSWVARAWCVADKACPPSTAVVVPTTTFGWLWNYFLWFLGLATSFVLVSLGAPFWAERLEQLLGWQSAVKKVKGDVAAAGGQTPVLAARGAGPAGGPEAPSGGDAGGALWPATRRVPTRRSGRRLKLTARPTGTNTALQAQPDSSRGVSSRSPIACPDTCSPGPGPPQRRRRPSRSCTRCRR
jgi:hypothetical protein